MLCLKEVFTNTPKDRLRLVHEMYNLVSQQEVIERNKMINEDLLSISQLNSGLDTFSTAKKKKTTGRRQRGGGHGTGNGTGNQRGGKSSKQGQRRGTQETALVVDNYMCIRTISNKACHCLADLWKIETDSTYRCPTCLSSEKITWNSLSRSTATCMSRIFWNTCTVRSNGAIMSFSLKARAYRTWDQGFYYLSANPFEN